MLSPSHPTSSRPRIPIADPEEREIVDTMIDDLLERSLEEASGSHPHVDALLLSVPLLETVLEDDPYDVPHELLARLVLFSSWPVVPEMMAVQTAFGQSAAETELDDLARLADRARRRGLGIDEYVERESRAGTLPRSRTAPLMRGETRRAPHADRMRRAETLFLRTASLVSEHRRADLLIAVAWLVWARGETPGALAYVREAARIVPGHPIAVGFAVHFARVQPRWVTRPRDGACG